MELCAAGSALPRYAALGPLGLFHLVYGGIWRPATQMFESGRTLLIFSRWRGRLNWLDDRRNSGATFFLIATDRN